MFGPYELLAKSGLFDAEYYARANPDIANLNIDPLTHYLETGATELRNPSEAFEARHYAQLCHERGEHVDNPLLHYIEIGAAQGLKPRPQEPSAALASGDNGAQLRTASAPAPQLLLGLDRIGIQSNHGVARLTGAGWCLAAKPIVELRVALGAIAVQARYGLPRTD